MIRRLVRKLPVRCHRTILWLVATLEYYLARLKYIIQGICKMLACMTYEGTLGEPEDFPRCEEPVWILGRKYSTLTELDELRSDVSSRLWMSYRRNFPQISNSGYTTDKGWGCMLRCGQMVVAEALSRKHLGRDWRWTPDIRDETYLRIVSLFEDNKCSTFSIHQMVQLGVDEGKEIGEWYGPNTVAQVLRKLTPFDEWNKLSIHVALDNIVIMDEIKCGCQSGSDRAWRPLILFIPLRLGLSEINPIYVNGIKKCLRMPQSLGLIGGKPNHASYFVGYMGDEVVYLDPHTTQDAGSIGTKSDEGQLELDHSYHCFNPQRLIVTLLDPSLSLCFYCGTEKEYDDLCNRIRQELVDGEKTPLFELCVTRPDYMKEDAALGATGIEMEDHHLESDDDEEFEVLQ
ncbi:cysteine protease ATG4B-like isoform X2 [Oratosquilla oratoria]